MSSLILMPTLGLIFLVSGCAGTASYVRSAAARDFKCDKSKIKVEEVGLFWRAEGCDQSGSYRCHRCDLGLGICSCTQPIYN